MHNKFHQLSKHLLVVLLTVVVASAQAQPPTTPSPPPQGLLSRLIEIKYTSELYLSTRLKSEGLSTAQKDTTLATYNTLRLKVDGFVYQLSSEMIAHNSPREFKKINEWCLQAKGNSAQVEALEEIENFYATNIKPVMITKTKTLNLTTNVFYLLKDSYTIVKGMSDMKTQKTMALIELLDHTRLLSPGEVGKVMGVGK
jgi:hypothetical protein